RLDGRLEDPGAIKALEQAGEDSNPELRQATAYALGFFGGDESSRVLRAKLKDVDCYVRYNAAVALGRRGDRESRGVFREMLSSNDLNKVVTLESPTEKHNKIEAIELEALQALEYSVDRKAPDLAESLRPEISTLSKSGLASVRNKALALLNNKALRN